MRRHSDDRGPSVASFDPVLPDSLAVRSGGWNPPGDRTPLRPALGGYFRGCTLKLSQLATAGATTVFRASSWFSLHLAEGHTWVLGFAYGPWFLAFLLLAVDRKRSGWTVIAGGALAMAFFEGNAYPVIYPAMIAPLVLATPAVLDRTWWPIIALVIAGLFGFGFAAPKLFSAIHIMLSHPRPIRYRIASSYGNLPTLLLWPKQ